ncbi:MAG TPA: hypothetical protein VF801_13765 [Rhodocyclaceae bacterium]
MRRLSRCFFDVPALLLGGLICAAAYAQAPQPHPGQGNLPRGPIFGIAHPQLIQLENDSSQLYKDQGQLIGRVGRDQTALSLSAKALGLLTTTAASVAAADTEITELQQVAQAMADMPEKDISEVGNQILGVLRPMKAQLHAANTRLGPIAKAAEPIREKLKLLATGAETLKTDLTNVNNLIVFNLTPLSNVVDGCLAFNVPLPVLDCSNRRVSDAASQTDKAVLEYDRVVRLLLTSPDVSLPDMEVLLAPLNIEIDALVALAQDIDKLRRQLDALSHDLKDLRALIDGSFCFKFPAFGRHHDVCVGFKTIMSGGEAIEKEIEHLLSKELWKALKVLGVKHFIHDLQNDAEKALHSVLGVIERDLNLKVPDIAVLGRVESALEGLAKKLPNINYPTMNLKLPSFGLPHIRVDIDLRWLPQFLGTFTGIGPASCSPVWAGCSAN